MCILRSKRYHYFKSLYFKENTAAELVAYLASYTKYIYKRCGYEALYSCAFIISSITGTI
jgi:hypothetical protein